MAGRQGREELIKQGLLEMMEQGKWAPRRVADLSGVPGAERTPGGVPMALRAQEILGRKEEGTLWPGGGCSPVLQEWSHGLSQEPR